MERQKADIVVLGTGGAGMVAAITAAEVSAVSTGLIAGRSALEYIKG